MNKTYSFDCPARIYCGTYAKYNNGSIGGAWLNLEDYADADAFFAACRELHADEKDPEFMFQDYKGFPEEFYSESMNEKEAEKLFAWLALDDDDKEMLFAYIDITGEKGDIADLVEQARDAYSGTYDSWEDMAEQFVEEGLFGDIPERLECYLDYEKMGRDLSYDYNMADNGMVFSNY